MIHLLARLIGWAAGWSALAYYVLIGYWIDRRNARRAGYDSVYEWHRSEIPSDMMAPDTQPSDQMILESRKGYKHETS